MTPVFEVHRTHLIDGREARKRSINQARASVRLEGTVLPPNVEKLNQRFIDGEITLDEHVHLVIELADAMVSKKRKLRFPKEQWSAGA